MSTWNEAGSLQALGCLRDKTSVFTQSIFPLPPVM